VRPRALLPALALAAAACTTGPAERVTVPPGATVHDVADSLKARGLIWSRAAFRVAARLRHVDRSVHAGIYEFRRGTSLFAILDVLAAGRIVAARITVPEGFTSMQIATVAEERLGMTRDSFLAVVRNAGLAESLGIPRGSLEGYLRPETYLVPANITARELARLMVDGFRASWDSSWTRRLDTLGMSQLEVLTLASIVEGEARVDSERETIAGVYRNRLRLGMPLQADPTVQYALGEHQQRLLYSDIREVADNPYNTYTHPGLPPGPIASPSEGSIRAVLYPAPVDYLYFVARPNGTHVFTRSLAEHNAAKQRIRRLQTAAAKSGKGTSR